MRTTVSIDDEVLVAAKRRAQRTGQTLGQVVEGALRRDLAADQPADQAPAIPVFTSGTGPAPGIDLNSNRALHEVLDGDSAVDQRH